MGFLVVGTIRKNIVTKRDHHLPGLIQQITLKYVLLLIRLNRDPCGNFHYHMGQLQKGASEGLFMSGLLRD